MSVPTRGETYSKLMWHLEQAQEQAAMLKHLHAAEGTGPDIVLAQGWMNVSEGLKRMQYNVMQFAKRGLQ